MSTPDSKPSKPDSDSPQNQEPIEQLDSPIDAKPEDAPSDQQEEEGEEEGECGFCLFMKAGGCRDSFIAWEKCIEEAEKNNEDVVDKCVEVTGTLKKCMEAHADYYEPILRAEKVAEQQFVDELDKEAAAVEKNADRSGSHAKEDSGKEGASEEK
ncbi:cilia- and flagella-associated protein 251 isoform X3 [Senna tora]|uniref:Cilia- and flagella-associated protein 251 isoform X3 n=1 Tax=Senna tora TaxID=362788 RepID=A0A834SSG9_9FABA|nr:cilia- and flagella-associated protein 251 isoform X3 [Senna tora]